MQSIEVETEGNSQPSLQFKAIMFKLSSLVGKTKRCFIKLNSLNYSMIFILSDIFKLYSSGREVYLIRFLKKVSLSPSFILNDKL